METLSQKKNAVAGTEGRGYLKRRRESLARRHLGELPPALR